MVGETVVSQGPCPDCTSSDACTLYDDGHTYCFSCGKHSGSKRRTTKIASKTLMQVEYTALTKRGITEETCKFWRYGTANGRQVAQFYRDNELIAQKTRDRSKNFEWFGEAKDPPLFGQWLWPTTGRKVVITEGEIDAMSVSQVQDNKWPVVSVPNGAAGAKKSVEKNLEWLNGYEEVIFMFDSDEAGRKAAKDCAAILPPGKAKIATLPLKDANEMLVAGRGAEIRNAMWNAAEYRPDGIVKMSECWNRMIDFKNYESIPYPWAGMNQKTLGLRRKEAVIVVAGTGVGKSEFVRQTAYHIIKSTDENVGYIALEEGVQRSTLGFTGLEMGKRLALDPRNEDKAAMKKAFDGISSRVFLYDHFGSTEGGNLLTKIRYMVTSLKCQTVILDHISIVVSGSEIEDERKALDVIATKLKSLTMELDFRLIVVVHTKGVDGARKTHEEGGRVTLQDIRGTRGIGQMADIVIGLERNQQSEQACNTTRVRVLKNRLVGRMGVACGLLFDEHTGILKEVEPPVEETPGGQDF